jgi:hypothetical protein
MEDPNCWQDLANAVILQAIEDYRRICGKLRFRPWLAGAARAKRELEEFFLSRWFRTLTTLDGQELLSSLRRETEGRMNNEDNRKERGEA